MDLTVGLQIPELIRYFDGKNVLDGGDWLGSRTNIQFPSLKNRMCNPMVAWNQGISIVKGNLDCQMDLC
jgi:hypothetical protein